MTDRLTNENVNNMIERYRERNFWQDRIVPPRRYFDNQPLGKVLLKDLATKKILKECDRTAQANSVWYSELISTGQFYKPLTTKRNTIRCNSNKAISMVSSGAG